MQRFGRIQKGRHRASRAHDTRRIARDMFRFADAGDLHAPAARLGRRIIASARPTASEIERVAQRRQFVECESEKLRDFL